MLGASVSARADAASAALPPAERPAIPSAPGAPRFADQLLTVASLNVAVVRVPLRLGDAPIAIAPFDTAALPAARALRPAPEPETIAPPNVFGSLAIPAKGLPVAARPQHVLAATFTPCADGDRTCRALSGDAAQSLLALAKPLSRAQQLQAINRGVNKLVVYVPDSRTYNADDHWATAAETLTQGAGDCEDIAIAKMWMLEQLGFADAQMFVIALRDTRRDLEHAVLAVRHRDAVHILDSATGELKTDAQIASYQPIFSLNRSGVWVHAVPAKPAAEPGTAPSS